MRVVRGRSRVVTATVVTAVLFMQMFGWVPYASAQFEPVDLRGFATGQPGHVSALESGGTRLGDVEVAWSGASVDADEDGLKGAKLNEMNRIFQADRPNKLTYARGSGLEVGVGTTPEDANQVQLAGFAEADAPPRSSDTQTIDAEGDPLAYASAARGAAFANSNDSGLVPDYCVLGDDLSRGIGYAADVELVDTGGDESSPQMDAALLAFDDQDPDRSVSQSTSRTKLVPNGTQNHFGLMSEVRQTIAPVTLLQADDNDPTTPLRQITIEVLGEWVLRAVSTGTGKSTLFYGPGETSPSTPILRIIDSADEVTDVLSFQDLFGDEGFTALAIPGLLEIALGEDPRAIAAPGEDPDPDSKPVIDKGGFNVAAAVDVGRIQLLSQPDPQAADIRIGHMEVTTDVPAGGVECPLPVTKSADPDDIKIGEEPDTSTVEITVHNVYDCDLENVVLTDRIRQREGDPDFKIVSAEPTPESPDLPTGVIREADVVWERDEPLKAGDTWTVSFDVTSATEGGILRDIAEAVGKFVNCAGHDVSGLAIAGLNLSGVSNPVDIRIETPVTGAAATRTVAIGGGLALGAAALGFVLRRRSLHKA